MAVRISIHTPHGERLRNASASCSFNRFQSTPHTRGATILMSSKGRRKLFQSTPPHGERLPLLRVLIIPEQFQSTPLHGERRMDGITSIASQFYFNPRPHTGSDDITPYTPLLFVVDFNPRPPHGERQRPRSLSGSWTKFQSTPPTRGATVLGLCQRDHFLISIHAPHTGSDMRPLSDSIGAAYFNPRPPHGERQALIRQTLDLVCHFNPRPPHGERRDKTQLAIQPKEFQSTPPTRGATPNKVVDTPEFRISIHAPHTGSDKITLHMRGKIVISIHAPHTGSDKYTGAALEIPVISIHAPHTGSDQKNDAGTEDSPHFNPRPPHGERRGVSR